MSCIKVPGLQNDQAMESGKDLLDVISKYKELITSANKVFGKYWSHAITNTTIGMRIIIIENVACDFNSGKFHVGCQATVKVQLSNGVYHEDVGYSSVDASTKGLAFEKARSISVTNALMKALSCFIEFKTEMELFTSNQNSAPNISNILRKEFVPKRPITPPPAAESTPKIPRNPATLNGTHGKRMKIADAPVTNTGLKIPEDSDKIDEVVECVDLDIIFDKNEEVSSANVNNNHPTSHSTAFTSTTMTKEERKRIQKEKQEEFKRQMKEKEEREGRNLRPDAQ